MNRNKGHEFIPQLVSAFPNQIRSVTLGKPTLEDVFIQHTGHRFWAHEKNLSRSREEFVSYPAQFIYH